MTSIHKGNETSNMLSQENCQNLDNGKAKEKARQEVVNLSPVPDKGWAWMILVACTYLYGMTDGTYSIFGVFLPQLLEVYQSDRATTAIIGSLLSALQLMSGPFVAAFISYFGCRVSAMLGALLITMGLVLSTLAPSIEVLIVTFGIIPGIGLAFIYLPAVVMVGFWFERRRSLAMGIASTGAGPAMMAIAPLAGLLLETFDWKNALMLLSGLMLQGVVCGALLRTLDYAIDDTLTELVENNQDGKTDPIDDTTSPDSLLLTRRNNPELSSIRPRLGTGNIKLVDVHHQEGFDQYDLGKKGFSSQPEINSSGKHYQHANPLLRKDIFYSGSFQRLYGNETTANCNQIVMPSSPQQTSKYRCYSCQDNHMQMIMSLIHTDILKDVSFWLIVSAIFLWEGGFVLCIYFITDYGIFLGIKPQRASYLVLAFGVGTTIGRLSGGIFSSLPSFRSEYVTTVSLLLAGLCSASIVLFCNGFTSLVICTGLAGLFIAPVIPLTSVMLVDYLGIENLTSAQGMACLGQGIAALMTAPFAGLLQDITGSISPPFYIAAVLFILAGTLHLVLLIRATRAA